MSNWRAVTSTWSHTNSLYHYGVRGMVKGKRRYQNEDGSYTAEGREHYGIGDPRQPAGTTVTKGISPTSKVEHNYRVHRFGKASTQTLERKPKKLSKQEARIRKSRAKRLLGAAAAVGLGVAIGYGIHRYNKTTDNLIQTAKNAVHETYKHGEAHAKNAQDRAKNKMWREHDISAINSRQAAKKVLGLKGSKATRQYIKDNHLATRKTSEIMERRVGKLVEGYQVSRITGKVKPYSERKRRRKAERVARNLTAIEKKFG